MARVRPPDRLDQLAEAAATVFTHKGYRALMADVAAEMGVSQGLLYTYVESKEALFHLVVEHLAGVRSSDPDLPLATPLPGETARLIRKALRQGMGMPALDAALERARPPADVRAEVAAIVGELYRAINHSRHLLQLVERVAIDVPEVAERFYRGERRPFIARLTDYIERRVAGGQFRPVPHAATAARLVVETVSWFANHRYGDVDPAMITDELAEQTVIDMLTAALVKEAR